MSAFNPLSLSSRARDAMASTPMDLDGPDPSSSPANGGTPIPTSLNIQRTLGGGLPSTSAVVDVIGNYRPTKVRENSRQTWSGVERFRSRLEHYADSA